MDHLDLQQFEHACSFAVLQLTSIDDEKLYSPAIRVVCARLGVEALSLEGVADPLPGAVPVRLAGLAKVLAANTHRPVGLVLDALIPTNLALVSLHVGTYGRKNKSDN